MKHMSRLLAVACLMSLIIGAVSVTAQESTGTVESTWSRLKSNVHTAFVENRIRAAYADRKDIPGGYIRIRFEGGVLELAGFAPNGEVAGAAELIARDIAKPVSTRTFWTFDESLGTNAPSYNTYVGEQTEDVLLHAKVQASLHSPAATAQLPNAELLKIDVVQGVVTLYVVADAPPGAFNLDPYIKPIPGVVSYRCQVVKAY